eukprot:TRINITY_DN4483_c0_g1_i1.p1 TRINITY_DN4483_c0_g1~~TRINITY_DN4483_c0_g1_i1.p1  ORF type:complete len:615 (+),score=166.84 TRINITY_DN4483_c0_g1_i1:72-1916(+)
MGAAERGVSDGELSLAGAPPPPPPVPAMPLFEPSCDPDAARLLAEAARRLPPEAGAGGADFPSCTDEVFWANFVSELRLSPEASEPPQLEVVASHDAQPQFANVNWIRKFVAGWEAANPHTVAVRGADGGEARFRASERFWREAAGRLRLEPSPSLAEAPVHIRSDQRPGEPALVVSAAAWRECVERWERDTHSTPGERAVQLGERLAQSVRLEQRLAQLESSAANLGVTWGGATHAPWAEGSTSGVSLDQLAARLTALERVIESGMGSPPPIILRLSDSPAESPPRGARGSRRRRRGEPSPDSWSGLEVQASHPVTLVRDSTQQSQAVGPNLPPVRVGLSSSPAAAEPGTARSPAALSLSLRSGGCPPPSVAAAEPGMSDSADPQRRHFLSVRWDSRLDGSANTVNVDPEWLEPAPSQGAHAPPPPGPSAHAAAAAAAATRRCFGLLASGSPPSLGAVAWAAACADAAVLSPPAAAAAFAATSPQGRGVPFAAFRQELLPDAAERSGLSVAELAQRLSASSARGAAAARTPGGSEARGPPSRPPAPPVAPSPPLSTDGSPRSAAGAGQPPACPGLRRGEKLAALAQTIQHSLAWHAELQGWLSAALSDLAQDG